MNAHTAPLTVERSAVTGSWKLLACAALSIVITVLTFATIGNTASITATPTAVVAMR